MRANGWVLSIVATATMATAQERPGPVPSTLTEQQRQVAGENATPGVRHVPAKMIPTPSTLDPMMARAVAAPYSRLWALSARDAAGWRAIAAQGDAQAAAALASARATFGVTVEPTTIAGVRAFYVTPRQLSPAHRDRLVVHVHGGGFIFGHGEAGLQEAMLLAALGGYRVLSVDYRMPPDAPFPAAIDDMDALWRALVKQRKPAGILLQGTSAGGNIALAFLLRAKAEGLPLPAAVALNSPAADFTGSGDSLRTNEWVDNVIVSPDAPYLRQVFALYAGAHDPKDPQISPLFGDYRGLPPIIITTGTRDLLLSDSIRVHRRLRAAGIEASLQVYEAMSHSQQLFVPTSPTTAELYREIFAFFDARAR